MIQFVKDVIFEGYYNAGKQETIHKTTGNKTTN